LEIDGVKVTVPQRGDKVRLIELSLRNARAYRLEKLKNLSIVDPDRHVNRLMKQMQTDLRLPVEPRHFECFDNSNFHGDFPVSACVVFKDGKPSKRDYRHFNVKTVEGPNDFATMAEVITRRYKRLLEEDQPLPQLILVDGGKGQLSAALEALNELGLRGKISIIGIAKRLEELYYPGDSDPLYLDKRSETLKVLQRARDEAHRFGITHHRNRRSKGTIATRLETIAGVGPATVELLLSHFKSAAGIERATLEEVVAVVGSKKAAAVKAALDAPEAEN
jgi:excinuclease ABC subunit C